MALLARRLGQAVDSIFLYVGGISVARRKQLSGAAVLRHHGRYSSVDCVDLSFQLTVPHPEWASGDRYSVVEWSNANASSSIYHKIRCQSSPTNVEIASQAQDGTTYYAMSTVSIIVSYGYPQACFSSVHAQC